MTLFKLSQEKREIYSKLQIITKMQNNNIDVKVKKAGVKWCSPMQMNSTDYFLSFLIPCLLNLLTCLFSLKPDKKLSGVYHLHNFIKRVFCCFEYDLSSRQLE
jgi:hypothetical protein